MKRPKDWPLPSQVGVGIVIGVVLAGGVLSAIWELSKWAAKLLVLLAVLPLTGCATLDRDDWSQADTRREIAFQLINAADAWQTSEIQDRPYVKEGGVVAREILGPEPETGDTVLYFATIGVSHYLVSRLLPAKWRPWWQRGTALYGGFVVYENCAEHDLC